MNLQDQSLHTLKQRVVQVSGDPLPFVEPPLHASLNGPRDLTHAELINCCEHDKERSHTRQTKPDGLVVRRGDGKIQKCPDLVPYAAIIAGHRSEAVAARWEIRIERLAPTARVLPILIEAFQLITEEYFFRCDQAEGSIVDLQIAN